MEGCQVSVTMMDEINQPEDFMGMSIGHGPEFHGDCFASIGPNDDRDVGEVPLWDALAYVERSSYGDKLVIQGHNGPSGGHGIDSQFKIDCDMVNIDQIDGGNLTCDDVAEYGSVRKTR